MTFEYKAAISPFLHTLFPDRRPKRQNPPSQENGGSKSIATTGFEPEKQVCDTKEEERQNTREAPSLLDSKASHDPHAEPTPEGILHSFCNACATQLATQFTAAQWRELAAFASGQAQAMEGRP